ncbi:hypothetical protein [Armatimonas sp.]|uniref:hypothetical protein n=1 Tax=Armatimonas sp. TaxID=1872638 RepID=UPI00286B7FAD|nr:hypothetical protein [Armatimonas sp.]
MQSQIPTLSFKQTLSRRFPLPPSGEVTLQADNGAIVVQGWERPEVAVELVVRADKKEKLAEVLPEFSAHPTHVLLRVRERYTDASTYDWRRDGPGRPFWPALTHIQVSVPSSARLTILSHNASLELMELLGEIEATTHNGRLQFSLTRGADQVIEAKTYNGKLLLPEPLFSWREPKRRAEARLGRATHRVRLSAFNGSLEVR